MLAFKAFAFFPVYYSTSDWLGRTFPPELFGSSNLSARFSRSDFGLLISERGALYFLKTNKNSILDGDIFNDYLYEKYNIEVPADAVSNIHVLSNTQSYYISLFADTYLGAFKGDGILINFTNPFTLDSIDNACLIPSGALYDYDKVKKLFYDGGDNWYNSPLIMNSGDEPCMDWFQGGYYNLSGSKSISYFL